MRKSIGNSLQLVLWHFVVLWKKIKENTHIAFYYYSNATFRKVDLQLKRYYLFKSAYRIASQHQVAYGHTPLPTLDRIFSMCHVSKGLVYDLGCGEGRGALFLHLCRGFDVVGVDTIGPFVRSASRLIESNHLKGISIQHKDILDLDFSKPICVYFFATGFATDFLDTLTTKLQQLPKGAKVITISEPLQSKELYLWKTFEADFYFGSAEVFCQIKK